MPEQPIAGIEIKDLPEKPTYTTTVPLSIGHTPDADTSGTPSKNPGQNKQMLESFSIMSKAATE